MTIIDPFFRELSAGFPKSIAPDDERRQTAISGVQKIVRSAIYAEHKGQDDAVFGADESLLRRQDLISKVLPATMKEACKLSTETLEYIVAQIKEVTDYKDWLHESLVQYPEWEKVTGKYSDIMVRDYVFLRDCKGMHCGPSEAQTLLEIYDVLGIKKGGVHLVAVEARQSLVRVLFEVVEHSRHIGGVAIGKSTKGSPQRSQAFNAGYERNLAAIHLSDEATEYLTAHPEHQGRLMEYMQERSELLPAVDFDHFTEYMHTSSSISSGVL
jgi:hypothetical protein